MVLQLEKVVKYQPTSTKESIFLLFSLICLDNSLGIQSNFPDLLEGLPLITFPAPSILLTAHIIVTIFLLSLLMAYRFTSNPYYRHYCLSGLDLHPFEKKDTLSFKQTSDFTIIFACNSEDQLPPLLRPHHGVYLVRSMLAFLFGENCVILL